MGKKSNKKSGKNTPVERPDATQGGPRAKVKKERVQPPKTVLRPASLGDVAAPSAADPVAAAEPKGKKQHAESATKTTSAKKAKSDKKSKSDKKDKSDEKAKSDKKAKSDEKARSDKKAKSDEKSRSGKKAKSDKRAKSDKKSETGNPGREAKQVGKSSLEEDSSAEKPRASAPDDGLSTPTQPGARKPEAKTPGRPAPAAGKQKPGKAEPSARERTVRDAALLSDEGDEAHGFARLIRAIPGIVALVEQHDTSVHRAVFDTYVTAVVEFGVDAADLSPIDIRTVAPDAPTKDERPTRSSGRSGSGAASVGSGVEASARRARRPSGINSAKDPEAVSPSSVTGAPGRVEDEAAGPGRVRNPGSSVRASTRVRAGQGRASAAGRAGDSAPDSRGGSTSTPIASRTRAGARGAASSRSRAASQAKRSLEDLASDLKPTNNGQRIAIAVAAILSADGEVTAAEIANAFERMTWRVPVNVAASVRQAARAGLVELEGPTGTRLSEDGERYVAGG
ncbi:hypothetical protein C5B99_05105 [Pseudoclavibacter sp. Z016]|nr:hypothetical protein C5B99_05105 [Pseudoclavibacter sp. Z016]